MQPCVCGELIGRSRESQEGVGDRVEETVGHKNEGGGKRLQMEKHQAHCFGVSSQ